MPFLSSILCILFWILSILFSILYIFHILLSILSNLIFVSLVLVSNLSLLYNMSLVSSILFNLALLLKIVSLVFVYTDISWNFSAFPWRATVTFTASHALATELTSAVTCRDGCARGSIAVAVASNLLPIFIMVVPFAIGVDGRIH